MCVAAAAMQKPGGLPGWAIWGTGTLMFNFKELPLWNAANMGESSRDPSMMDVDLDHVVHVVSPPPKQKTLSV